MAEKLQQKSLNSQKSLKTPALRVLHLYPNMMDLYGDSGNLQILRYRAEKRGIEFRVDSYQIGDPAPAFSHYDLIFLGGGSDKEQKVVARDILRHKAALKTAFAADVFFLTICGGFQLFGKYYKDAEDNLIKGLGFFDFYTESSTDKRQRCIGNIVIETSLAGRTVRLAGFENHGGQTHNIAHPFGRVLFGNGNTFRSAHEGCMLPNFIGTYLHGPLLAKNPELSDYILSTCLAARSKNPPHLAKLDDQFELRARAEMLKKLL